jgi:hypothetical protein
MPSVSRTYSIKDFRDRHSDTTNDGGADDGEGTDTGTITGLYWSIPEPDTHSVPPQLKLPPVNDIAGSASPTDGTPNPHPNRLRILRNYLRPTKEKISAPELNRGSSYSKDNVSVDINKERDDRQEDNESSVYPKTASHVLLLMSATQTLG